MYHVTLIHTTALKTSVKRGLRSGTHLNIWHKDELIEESIEREEQVKRSEFKNPGEYICIYVCRGGCLS